MRGGARGAPLGMGRSITPPRQTGEHATQPLHSLLERPTSAGKTGSPFQFPTSCTPAPLFVFVSGGWEVNWTVRRDDVSEILWIYPMGKIPQK